MRPTSARPTRRKSHSKEIEAFLNAYLNGATADMVQSDRDGSWGPIWTVPPCDARAMERLATQLRRSRATRVRHLRRVALNVEGCPSKSVMIVTELPERAQEVFSLQTRGRLRVERYLEDEALAVLRMALFRVEEAK